MVGFAIQLNLIGLHHLLNCLSNVTQTHINASVLQHKWEIKPFSHNRTSEGCGRVLRPYLDSSVGGFSHSLQQLVVLWVKCDGESTVDDSSCKHTQNHTFPPVQSQAPSNLTFFRNIPLMCVPKSILQTSSYCRTVVSPALGV